MPRWSGGTLTIDEGEVKNSSFSNNSADRLDSSKQQHRRKLWTNFDLAIGATPVAREEIVFVATSSGTIAGVHCLLNDTGTSTDVDFEVKKNGTTVLSSAVNITHGDADKAVKDGTLSVTTFAADDVISIELIVTSSTGAQGPFAWVELDEYNA